MIRFSQRGSFDNITKFFKWAEKKDIRSDLHDIGRVGCRLLALNTPIDTGLTAASWFYEVVDMPRGYRIVWSNSNVSGGAVIAILLQYGHATGTGGYVPAVDYINPVMEPIFGNAVDDFWEEVTNA